MKRLGKGLAEIIEHSVQASPNALLIRTDQIKPGRYQPRQAFDQASLDELTASIKSRGIIQPLIVRPIAHGIYELVAGERRWRAAQALGLPEVPAVIRALSDQETLELSLIENLQRADLNAIEESRAYARLMEEFTYTQEQVADVVGKERSSVANALRLLRLPEDIQQALIRNKISVGHAKVLLGVEPVTRQLEAFAQITVQKLSVAALEQLVVSWKPRLAKRRKPLDAQAKATEDLLRQALGTKVNLSTRKKGGRIVIDFFSHEDLTRILQLLGVRVDG